MKLLSISDVELGILYSPQIVERFRGIDFVISCGDLPYFYLEYVLTMLNVPLFYVHGNHANQIEHSASGDKTAPEGGFDLNLKHIRWNKILMTGVEGCLQYNYGPYQFTQMDMWTRVLSLVPGLIYNKSRCGRYLDLFITHAPAWGIHDQADRPHQGIKAFTWLIKTFQPQYHVHGHIHVYRGDMVTSTWVGKTLVVNTYGYKELSISPGMARANPDMVQHL